MDTALHRTLISLAVSLTVAACGGGGSGNTSTSGTNTGANASTAGTSSGTPTASGSQLVAPPAAGPASAPMTMSCADGANYQCSGTSIIRTDNGIALTNSGVQVYGKSTSDLATPILDVTTASGFTLTSGGTAEMRIAKDNNGVASNPALLLSNLGISWDGQNERPQIIETFLPTQGRVELSNTGALTFRPLAASSDLSFYDFATKSTGATQTNYANNRYFPRVNNPSRCGSDVPAGSCPTVETVGPQVETGDWRTGGTNPDILRVDRLHEDGDVHAGNGTPGPNNTVTILLGGSGISVPFPGTKGYRGIDNFSYRYANLTRWVTQDGVNISEWGARNEHNQNRRGIISFGDVTSPAAVPTNGTATYSGIVRGWYVRNPAADTTPFRAAAVMTVDFSTRQAVITIQNAISDDVAANAVPANFKVNAGLGAAGSNVANYATGAATSGQLTGGLSARFFGPVLGAGTPANGPTETGAAFSLSNATTGETIIGGFVARKQ